MATPPQKSPPAKKAGFKPESRIAALKKSLGSDGFTPQPKPLIPLDSADAAMDRGKAVAGIAKHLIDRAPVPPEVTQELNGLAKNPLIADEWQLLQRVVLGSDAPTTAEDAAKESRRFMFEVEGPLARWTQSFHLRRLYELRVPATDLFRGADVVVLKGEAILKDWVSYGAREAPPPAPFPGARLVELPGFSVLFFAKSGEADMVVRLEAPLMRLRKLAPNLMAFFEQHFTQDLNVGPMGRSPKTLRAARAVTVSNG